ncbi:hypothetical protein [Ornithinibacillus scapharcae]|nr:hypothetical protein [Ornithinibacillus scapharcae]
MKATNSIKTKNQSSRRPIVIRGQQLRKSPTIRTKGCGCGWKAYGSQN